MANSLFDDIKGLFESSQPEPEPENYQQFKDRIIRDIGAAFPTLKGTPEPTSNDSGEGESEPKSKKSADEKPKETHPFFKNLFGKEE